MWPPTPPWPQSTPGSTRNNRTSTYLGSALVAAVEDGQVSRATVNDAALRILTQMYRFRLFTDDTKGAIRDNVATAADAEVSNSVAEEGTVLLKNADHLLPLAKAEPGGIAVIGPAAQADPISAGGGSATVTESHLVTPLTGIRKAIRSTTPITYTAGLPGAKDFVTIPSTYLSAPYPAPGNPLISSATLIVPQTGTYELAYSEPPYLQPGDPLPRREADRRQSGHHAAGHLHRDGAAHRRPDLHPQRSGAATHLGNPEPDHQRHRVKRWPRQGRATTAVVVVGDGQESEAGDRVDLALPSDQDQLVEAVAGVNKHTVVVIDAGGPVAMPWLGEVSSVLDAWYPGQTDGTALAAVLYGDVDPSGHLPMTFPTATTASPVSSPAQFPGTDGRVDYSEGVDVGYRWYDATGYDATVPVRFRSLLYDVPLQRPGGPRPGSERATAR